MNYLNLGSNPVIKVVLVAERGLPRNNLQEVVRCFERTPGPIVVSVAQRPVELALTSEGVLLWDAAFAKLRELRTELGVTSKDFVILLTKSPNEDNWYAVQDPDNMRNGFGHETDFSWATSAPNSVITTHYLLKSIFNALLADCDISWMDLLHKMPRGCFFDFCANKSELNFKLRTADICGDCLQVFREIGIPDALLVQTVSLMEAGRPLALSTSQFRLPEASFDRWPFPVAVTKHKVVQATNPLLRFLLLLDHFDSLIRYFYLTKEVLAGKVPVLDDKPSLGWWLDQLAHSLKGQSSYREVVAIAQRENVVALRNERRGHGWMAANAEAYIDEAKRLEGIIVNIEDEMTPFFESHRLLIPRQVEPQGDVYVVTGDALQGSNPLYPPFQTKLTGDPLSVGLKRMNDGFVCDARMERFQCISPNILSAVCPTCHHPRILITDGGDRFIDVFVGHRVELKGVLR